MRHFTDAAAAQLALDEQQTADAPYELILADGRCIAVPDYPALAKAIAQLEVTSFRVRVREVTDGNGGRPIQRA